MNKIIIIFIIIIIIVIFFFNRRKKNCPVYVGLRKQIIGLMYKKPQFYTILLDTMDSIDLFNIIYKYTMLNTFCDRITRYERFVNYLASDDVNNIQDVITHVR